MSGLCLVISYDIHINCMIFNLHNWKIFNSLVVTKKNWYSHRYLFLWIWIQKSPKFIIQGISSQTVIKVIWLCWGYRFWFLLIFLSCMSIFGENSLNVTNVKLLSIFFPKFLAFLCIFGENDSLQFTYYVISLASSTQFT